MEKKLLKGIVIEEVAHCRQGINPGADLSFTKSKDGIVLGTRLRKDHEGPRSFDEVIEQWSAWDISEAIDLRLDAFSQSAWEILSSDASDKEALLAASLQQFAATLEQDIPDLISRRIVKALTEPTDMGKLAEIRQIAKSVTEGDEPMAKKTVFDKSKLDDAGTAEFDRLEKAIDDLTKTSEAAVEFGKACEYAAAAEAWEKSDPDNSDPILKAIPESLRPFFKAQREEIEQLKKAVGDGQTFAKMSRLNAEAAELARFLPLEKADIAEALSVAEDAGEKPAALMRKAYQHSVEMIKAAHVLGDPLGSDETVGNDDELGQANAKLTKMAQDMATASKGEMSFEKAYSVVLDANPDLYDAADVSQYRLVETQ